MMNIRHRLSGSLENSAGVVASGQTIVGIIGLGYVGLPLARLGHSLLRELARLALTSMQQKWRN